MMGLAHEDLRRYGGKEHDGGEDVHTLRPVIEAQLKISFHKNRNI